jgi:hypothetical protein
MRLLHRVANLSFREGLLKVAEGPEWFEHKRLQNPILLITKGMNGAIRVLSGTP